MADEKRDNALAIVAVVGLVGLFGLIGFMVFQQAQASGGVLQVSPNSQGGFTIVESQR